MYAIARSGRARTAGRATALSDGRRRAGGYRRGGRPRHRHLRLRAAHPRRRATAGCSRAQGRINLRNARYAADPLPVEPGCDCYSCQHFSRAYLRHLFKAGEILGLHLATVHNVRFMIRLMTEIREHIKAGTFPAFREQFLADYQLSDQEVRHAQRNVMSPANSASTERK